MLSKIEKPGSTGLFRLTFSLPSSLHVNSRTPHIQPQHNRLLGKTELIKCKLFPLICNHLGSNYLENSPQCSSRRYLVLVESWSRQRPWRRLILFTFFLAQTLPVDGYHCNYELCELRLQLRQTTRRFLRRSLFMAFWACTKFSYQFYTLVFQLI